MWPASKTFINDSCVHFAGGCPTGHIRDCNASIMVVGEAGGRTENEKGVPFVGAAGRLLNRLLVAAGVERADIYFTNIVPWQPPKGDDFESVPPEVVAKGTRILRAKAASFNGRLVVPLGGHALVALTGLAGIMKWRGSVLDYRDKHLVASVHPAAILRGPLLWKTALYDWKRIKEIIDNGWRPPNTRLICTTWNDKNLIQLRHATVLSCDIETVRGTSKVLCISLCADGRESYSVDCRKGIPPIVKELLESSIPKIFTNGLFDCYILALNRVRVGNFRYDTSLMFHALDNNAGPVTSASSEHGKSIIKPYSLAYGASVFTPFTYWKDSGKDSGTGENESGARRNWHQFSEYNARDSLGSYWLALALLRKLKEENRLDHYKFQYERLLYPILDLSLHGLRFDTESAASHSKRLQNQLIGLRDRCEAIAGRPLRTIKTFAHEPKVVTNRKDKLAIRQRDDGVWIGERKSISNAILQNYLYKRAPEGLGLKRQTKAGATTSDEVAIRNCMLWVKENATFKGDIAATTSFLESILAFREAEKTLQFLNSSAVDNDGRIRAAYGLAVQSGRLRSSSNPAGTGFNLQNIQRDIRHYFLPDSFNGETSYFLELDYKQAEDLVVKAISYAITKDNRPLDLIRAVCDGSRDIHRALATTWTNKAAADITYEERYVTKRCRHGINNGMRFRRMQQTLLKDGFVLSLHEVKRIFRAINEAEPWVEAFHQAIRRTIMRHGGVATSWGWQLDMRVEMDDAVPARFKEEAYKRGYTFIEQSEVCVMMKQWGIVEGYEARIKGRFRSRLNMETHDNVVLSVPRSELYDVMSIIYAALVRPRAFGIFHPSFCVCGACDKVETCEITIPAEIKISRTLSCSCSDCKTTAGRQPLEFTKLPAIATFNTELVKWEAQLKN